MGLELLDRCQRLIGVGLGSPFAALTAQEHRLILECNLDRLAHRTELVLGLDGAKPLFLGQFPVVGNELQAHALTGKVTSAKEGAMEGVVVSAKRAGGTITVSVITDATGTYSFPTSRLEPGEYTLGARAVGYDLDGPGTAKVTSGPAATADIKLKPTHNLPDQLTNAEWMLSVPGTD